MIKKFYKSTFLTLAIVSIIPTQAIASVRQTESQWHLDSLGAHDAHRIARGAGVIVAVVDTGVFPHNDLRRNLLPGTDSYNGGMGDGREDLDGHGTKMAGLIAAHGSGPRSTLGVAPETSILPVRDGPSRSAGDIDDTAAGIEWATRNKANVICISSAGSSSPRLRAAIQLATESDIVVVAAAGNAPTDNLIGFPAAIDVVVAVGAVDRHDRRSSNSVTGEQLDIVAPGVDITGPGLGGGYVTGTGTSNSAAIVAGAAALVRSRFPELSAEEVVHRLTYTAVDKGPPGRDDEYGHGVLDLVAALTADVPPLGDSATPSATPPSAPADSAQPREESGGSGVGSVLASLAGFSLAVGLLVLGYRRHRRRNPR